MCGRFTLTVDPGLVARRFGAPPGEGGGTQPRYNVAPAQTVITVTDDGVRHLEQMRWGLIPSWAKDPKIGSRMINARAETLAEKPAFRNALKRRRCLIPADGFYEWTERAGRKQPMRITLRSGEPFAFAGLWESWTPSAEATPVRTCTIVTTSPNALMATIHHRMPVILTPEAEAIWLDPSIADPAKLLPLLVPYPADEMVAYPVSSLVNSPANDSPQLVLPLDVA
ncbi:MAG: SOS response-associated peptidase [Chloroflexi bacterium]|nr:SOS response-associated peptidase [Chloroflexota bacterium]